MAKFLADHKAAVTVIVVAAAGALAAAAGVVPEPYRTALMNLAAAIGCFAGGNIHGTITSKS